MLGLLAAVVVGACGDGSKASDAQKEASRWLPLDGEGAWTWREDNAETPPDEATLLHGRDMGQGRIELRRGPRWADADVVGGISFSVDDGIVLEALSLDDFSMGAARPLAPAFVDEGSVVTDGSWRCTVALDEEIETFYAVFDQTLVSTCEGNQLPAGMWVFAEGMGLVAVFAGNRTLDLVAPW